MNNSIGLRRNNSRRGIGNNRSRRIGTNRRKGIGNNSIRRIGNNRRRRLNKPKKKSILQSFTNLFKKKKKTKIPSRQNNQQIIITQQSIDQNLRGIEKTIKKIVTIGKEYRLLKSQGSKGSKYTQLGNKLNKLINYKNSLIKHRINVLKVNVTAENLKKWTYKKSP